MSGPANTKLDDFPTDFTLESLTKHLSPQEVDAIQADKEIALDDAAKPAPDVQAVPEVATQPVQPAAAAAPAMPAIPDTTEAEAKIAASQAELDALADKYDNGELSRAELQEQQRAMIAEQARAQVVLEQAKTAIEAVRQSVEQQWYSGLDAFKAQGNEVLWSSEHVAGWDAALKTVSGTPNYADLPVQRQFELAKQFYAADYQARTGTPLTGTAAPQIPANNTPDKARTDPRDPPVQTLGGLNGDATGAITDGTFAAIDRMMSQDPVKAEEMIRGLTPSQQKQFYESV